MGWLMNPGTPSTMYRGASMVANILIVQIAALQGLLDAAELSRVRAASERRSGLLGSLPVLPQPPEAVDQRGCVGERFDVVDEGVQPLVVAGGGHVELFPDG